MTDKVPEHRIWLQRFRKKFVRGVLCQLYDAATGERFGIEFRYPAELEDAKRQLNIFRTQFLEPLDNYLFADKYGSEPRGK